MNNCHRSCAHCPRSTITSSPGFMLLAPTAAIKPEVQELNVKAYLTLNFFLIFFSNSKFFINPNIFNPLDANKLEMTPLFNTFSTDFISALPIVLNFLNGLLIIFFFSSRYLFN